MWCVCSVYDKKAQEFGQLILARTEQVGARMFADAVTRGETSNLREHPEDFDFMCVGTFDEGTGVLSADEPHMIVTAWEIVRRVAANSPGDPVLVREA